MIAGWENKFYESLKLNKRIDIENRIITRRYIQEAQYITNKNVEDVQNGIIQNIQETKDITFEIEGSCNVLIQKDEKNYPQQDSSKEILRMQEKQEF